MKGTPQHSASITRNKDGTLNYGVPHSLRPVAASWSLDTKTEKGLLACKT